MVPSQVGVSPQGSLASASPWFFRCPKGRAIPLGSLGAIEAQPSHLLSKPAHAHAHEAARAHVNGPAHAHVPVDASSDEEANLPTRDEVEWAVEQLPDQQVADVRAALANAPWLGKPWSVRWRGSPHRRRDRPVGTKPLGPYSPSEPSSDLDALSFFGGLPEQV